MFAVLVTGPPGAGKTVVLTALSDALVSDEVAHATIDVDEVAWAFPFPDNDQRCAHLRAAWRSHREAGSEALLVAEVVESSDHLADILESVGADDHLLVRLEAPAAVLRERILAREPAGWFGLEYLLAEMERTVVSLAELDGVHAALDTERLSPEEAAARIRAERPDQLGG